MSQFFPSGGQNIGGPPSHWSLQRIFRTDFLWDVLVVSPCSSCDSQESCPTPQFKSISSLVLSFIYGPTHIHSRLLEKAIALTIQTFSCTGMSLLFSMLSRFSIALFQGACVLFFTAAVIICSDFGSQGNKCCYCFHCFSMYLP